MIRIFIRYFKLSLIGLAFTVSGYAKSKESQLAEGKKVYLANCVACHGTEGDGNGVAARAIATVKPRDFIKGIFKYGDSDEAVFKTITNGVPGTAMPPWSMLSDDDRKAVVQYIKSLKK